MAEERTSMSGLTDAEAKELHEIYMKGFVLFTGVAVVAHFLVWLWRPWLAGPGGFTASLHDVAPLLTMVG